MEHDLVILLSLLLGLIVVRRQTRLLPVALEATEPTDLATREDMIYIWTEINGIPRQKAEAIWESYERAKVVASLNLKSM